MVGQLLWDYSRVIYGPSKMKFILGVFDEIYSQGIRSLNNITVIKNKKFYNTTAHRKFLELCKQNKTEEAIKGWQKHLLNIKKITLSDATK